MSTIYYPTDCPTCADKIEDLEDHINSLKDEISNLEKELDMIEGAHE